MYLLEKGEKMFLLHLIKNTAWLCFIFYGISCRYVAKRAFDNRCWALGNYWKNVPKIKWHRGGSKVLQRVGEKSILSEIFCFYDSGWGFMKMFTNLSLLSVLRDCSTFLLLTSPLLFLGKFIHPLFSDENLWSFFSILPSLQSRHHHSF